MAGTQQIQLSKSEMDYGSRGLFEKAVNADKKGFASVRITEYPDSGSSNPEPISDTSAENFEDFLSPQFLKSLTGKNNLSDVKVLELQVDTSETSIGNLGHLLPNLAELKLSNSTINSVRDLGTSLTDLNTLWLSRCSLVDLDGISCFYSIKELYLAYNEIDDISSISMLDSLEVLDLEGNNVDDIAQVEFLGLCSKLRNLTLSGNPVELCPHPDTKDQDLKFYEYRSAIAKAIPHLQVLDDEVFIYDLIGGKRVIHARSINRSKDEMQFKEDLLLVQDSIKALPPIDEDDDDDLAQELNSGGRTSSAGRHRPGSASGRSSVARQRPASGRNRPLSSRNRPMSSRNRVSSQNNIPERPGTSYKRPDSTMPDSARGMESPDSMNQDDSSDLTHGSKQVLCGNPVRALLARRRELKNLLRLKLGRDSPEENPERYVPEHSYHDDDDDENDDESFNRSDVFEELKKWRENFERNSGEMATTPNIKNHSQDEESKGTPLSPTLSPTPPPGDPSRLRTNARRHARKSPAEPSRPQTAYDFRSKFTAATPNRNPTEDVTKSLDMNSFDRLEYIETTNTELSLERSNSNQDNPSTSRINHDVPIKTRTPSSSVRPKQFRPGTAAAAMKKTSKKHFT